MNSLSNFLPSFRLDRVNLFTNRDWKVRVLQLINHIGFIYALTLMADWRWWLASVAVYFFMFGIGVDVGVHRYFSHKAFETSRGFEWFFCFCLTLSSIGSSLAWIGMHRMHHRFSDGAKDPHSPVDREHPWRGFWRAYFGFWKRYSAEARYVSDVRKQSVHKFFHFNYLLVIGLWAGALSLFGLKAVLFLYCVPAVYCFHAASLIVSAGHTFGAKRYANRDESRNNLFVHLVTWGEGLHNEHHAFPMNVRYHHPNPLFFDLPGFLIENVFASAKPAVQNAAYRQ
jgi:fatty-acid desaturase